MPNAAENQTSDETVAMAQGIELPVPAPMPPEYRNADPGLLGKLFDRWTTTGQGAVTGYSPSLPQRTVTFDVDGADCEPGVFVDDNGEPFVFSLTLKTLLPEEELKALDAVQSPSSAPMYLAKAMLWKVNGEPVKVTQREWFWRALGMRGRNLCFIAYQQIGGATVRSMGKLQSSISIGSTAT